MESCESRWIMNDNDMLSKIMAGFFCVVLFVVGFATDSVLLGFGVALVALIICWVLYSVCKSVYNRLKNKKLNIKYIFAIIGIIVVLAGMVVLSYSCVNNGIAENTERQNYLQEEKERESNLPKCRNCGRRGNVVAGFGYCYDCYESFNDWLKNN